MKQGAIEMFLVRYGSISGTNKTFHVNRIGTYVDDVTYNFGSGYRYYDNSAQQNDSFCIPVKIYGGKFV